MPIDNRNIRREFSYTRPILYAGESYPSADSMLSDESGNETKGRIFTDANGQYYTLGANGFPIPVMPKETLDEVTVSAPRNRESLFKNYLLGRNDNTQVTNLPHREYNSNLTEAGLRGAAYHADWDRQHPNLSAWRDAATAVPFAVAVAPAVIGGGQAALGTSLGQAAVGLGSRVMANPIVDAANTALGLSFVAKGAYDASQGEFTPQTVMDLAGIPLSLKSGVNVFNGLRRNNFQIGKYLTEESSIPRSLKSEGAKRYITVIESPNYRNRMEEAGLGSHWQDMRDLTEKQLDGIGYFPGRMQKIVKNDPNNLGLAGTGSMLNNPYYGITLKKSLYPDKIMPTLDHEIAHWATENAGIHNKGFLGDIMRYNEGIVPNIPWEDVLRKEIQANPNMTVDEATQLEEFYNYLIDPQEKRSRAMSIYQQAKDSNMTTDDFVDMWTNSKGEIYNFAPQQLRDTSKILTVDNIKKYLNKFLGVAAPVGMGATFMYNQNSQNYDR